jgi:glycosyltransferase involved in cell wall biosynthesis
LVALGGQNIGSDAVSSIANLSRWAVVAHKDDTGFGRQASDIRAVLGLGKHLVVPSERLIDHPLGGDDELWFPSDSSDEKVIASLVGLEGIIFFERPNWHPRLLKLARKVGVKTVCVPNWEWFRGQDPLWKLCDLFVCPSQFTEKVVRGYGFRNTMVLPWPLDLKKLPKRTVTGPAKTFLHNAGIVDPDDRKGTRDTIRAFTRVKRDDIRLIVRMQKNDTMPPLDERIELKVGNCPDVRSLYETGDVCIQPSKMEGLGFMVLEPVASGLPVVTTNCPPMNEMVRQPAMRCALKWFKRKAYATKWVSHAHLRLPREQDLAAKINWCANNDMGPFSQENRAWSEARFEVTTLIKVWSNALSSV